MAASALPVVVFTLYPIALVLFKEGNVSKRLFPAALFAGCASFTMVGLPGSPQIQNIMPTEVLGNHGLRCIPSTGYRCFHASSSL